MPESFFNAIVVDIGIDEMYKNKRKHEIRKPIIYYYLH